MRPHQVWRHELGTPTDDDHLVFEEDDERFAVSVGPHPVRRRISLITSESKLTSEARYLAADDPTRQHGR